jgi:uncharacterized protein YdbL (DUF1318 family)
MSKNHFTKLGLFSVALALFAGCVTINVNFPEGAAQKASDDFVKELYRARDRSGGSEPSSSPSPSAQWWQGLMIAEALADEAFKVSSAKTLEIRDRMRKRLDELLTHKRSGLVGEDNLGLLLIRDKSQVKPILLKKLEKLVGEENSDRAELYAEVARLNNLKPTNMKDVGRTFSHSFQAESPSGTWVQSDGGDWSRKN